MRPLVIGVGNSMRGDDGVGREVARLLRSDGNIQCDLAEAGGEATGLLSLFEGRRWVIIVDACQSSGSPGTIRHVDVSRQALPASCRNTSSHGFGVAEAIELARVLGKLPPQAAVIAVEGRSFDLGQGLSPEAKEGASRAAARVRLLLEEMRRDAQ